MASVRKLVGQVRISLYEGGQACVEGDLEGEPCPLSNIRFYRDMLRAAQDAIGKHYRDRKPLIVVPRGIR